MTGILIRETRGAFGTQREGPVTTEGSHQNWESGIEPILLQSQEETNPAFPLISDLTSASAAVRE